MSTCASFLPKDGIPPLPGFAGQTLRWLDTDSPERFREEGHEVYGDGDIEYRFNSLGYRGAEFAEKADIRIVAAGCSYVLGVGLPAEALFQERFAMRLRAGGRSVVVWNLGAQGASNDYINRILQLAVPHLDPHVVLVNFTHPSRREYVSVQNQLVRYYPDWRPPNLVARAIKRQFDALSSSQDDCLNFFRNYRGIAGLLRDRCWLFTTVEPLGELAGHVEAERYAGVLEPVDRARDDVHPGPASHAALAKRYWKWYQALRANAGGFGWE